MAIADQRLELSLAWSDLGAPVSLSLDDLERMNLVTGQFVAGALETSALSGSRVAGNDAVTGRARVITDAAQIAISIEGDLLDASEALQSTMERQGLKDVCDDQRDKVRTGRDDQPEPSSPDTSHLTPLT